MRGAKLLASRFRTGRGLSSTLAEGPVSAWEEWPVGVTSTRRVGGHAREAEAQSKKRKERQGLTCGPHISGPRHRLASKQPRWFKSGYRDLDFI